METEVEEIKKKLDIVNVIGKFITLKKRGRTHMACCPFHNEKTPSFTVSPELQIFKCFGCGKAGDIFTFIQDFEKVGFHEALEIAAKMAGVTLKKSDNYNYAESQKKRLFLLNQEICKFFNYILLSHPFGENCLEYLTNRNLSIATIKEFMLGFAPQNDDLLLNYLKKKEFTQTEITSSGVFSNSQYGRLYNRFKNRLIFPLYNHRGDVCGFSGRVLPDADKNQAKYINSPETEIYHKSDMVFGLNLSKNHIRETQTCLITEGEFDMISPYQAGIKNIVAVKGTAFTIGQLQLLKRFCNTLVLALDSDIAGNTAALRSIELADSMDFDIKVLDLSPKYKDPDEAVNGDLEFFQTRLTQVLPVWDFVINSAVKRYGVDSIKGKKEIIALCLPFISKISNEVIKSDYLKKLADVLGSDINSVFAESKKYLQPVAPIIQQAVKKPENSFEEKLEERLFTLILFAKKPHLVAKRISENYEFQTSRFKSIFEKLLKTKKYIPAKFQTKLSPELVAVFQSLFLESKNQDYDSFRLNLEIKKIVNQLKIQKIKQEIEALSKQIGDDGQKELEIRYNKLLVTLRSLQIKK